MIKLTSSIKAAIEEHPTQTILRSENADTDQEYLKVIKVFPVRNLDIPNKFDGRVIWKGMLTEPLEQGKCGSCWAFASTGALSDRFNISSQGKMHVELSPTKLILCNWQGKELSFLKQDIQNDSVFEADIAEKTFRDSACFGNTLVDACRYLYQVGTPTLKCIPYDQALGSQAEFQKLGNFDSVAKLPVCSAITGLLGDMCAGSYIDTKNGTEYGEPQRFYRAINFYGIPGVKADNGGEFYIRDNIYKWGTLATAMKIYPDFYTFKPTPTNVYRWNGQGEMIGGHAVSIVGWGVTDSGEEYWIIRNSWGKKWGIDGYFYIARGTNECEIEENCIGMIPDFFYGSGYKLDRVRKDLQSEKLAIERDSVYNYINSKAGGIDPNTGYTRRIEIQMPWLDLSRPINLDELPDWKTFVGAIDSDVTSQKYQRMIKGKVSYESKSWIYVLIILFILIIALIFLIIKK